MHTRNNNISDVNILSNSILILLKCIENLDLGSETVLHKAHKELIDTLAICNVSDYVLTDKDTKTEPITKGILTESINHTLDNKIRLCNSIIKELNRITKTSDIDFLILLLSRRHSNISPASDQSIFNAIKVILLSKSNLMVSELEKIMNITELNALTFNFSHNYLSITSNITQPMLDEIKNYLNPSLSNNQIYMTFITKLDDIDESAKDMAKSFKKHIKPNLIILKAKNNSSSAKIKVSITIESK